MSLLTWNHACSVGVKALDEQHAVLMDTLNDIRLAFVQGQGREHVSEGLYRLVEFTRMHFASEEQLLERYAFPGTAEHRNAHQKLLVEIEDAALHTQHSDDLHMRAILLFLRQWYTRHIEDLDSQYGPWLNARGVS